MRCVKSVSACFLAIMISLLFSPSSGLWCAEKISEPFKYSGYTFPEYKTYARSSEYVTVSDGTKLAITRYMPSGGPSEASYPVIFIFTPYHREKINPETGELVPQAMFQGITGFFTSYGYAMVTADMRGCGASYGSKVADLSPDVAGDGRDITDWIAAQPWCNGNVGMMGGSYYGFAVHATAGKQPEALKCILPSIAHFDAFSSAYFYPGGIFNKDFVNRFGDILALIDRNKNVPGFLPAAPVIDEDNDGELIDEIPLDLDGDGSFAEDYQLPGNPPQYSDGQERQHIYYLATLDHLSNLTYNEWPGDLFFRDAVITEGYTFEDLGPSYYPAGIAESGVPVFGLSGWFDCFVLGTAQWYSTLRKTNPSRLVIGPTNHITPGFAMGRYYGPYVEHFGEDPEDIASGYNLERLRFLDHYLKGTDNGIDEDPPVHIYVMNGQGWRLEHEWPLDRQEIASYYFESDNSLSLTRKTEGTDDYQADFTHNSMEPSSLRNRYTMGLPDNIGIRTDMDMKCLTYTAAPLKEDTEVTGHPVAHLWVSSNADYGDFFVFLEDVDETGKACYVTDGVLRAGFAGLVPNEDMLSSGGPDVLPDIPWHGFRQEDYVDGIFADGNIAELVIDFMPTSWVFKKGHRIRVSIASADWPTFRLHPELSPSDNPEDTDNIIPIIKVHRTAEYPSRIDLPIIPSKPVKKISEPYKYSGYTFPEYSSYAGTSEYVTMSDDVKLAVVKYLPTNGPGQGPFPTIFIYMPYHRESINPETGQIRTNFSQESVSLFTSYGYAMVFADLRGTGASFGANIIGSPRILDDGKELTDWIAAQPWCDGNIGMLGGSYHGWTQLAVAAQKPEALKCIIPESISFDAFSSAVNYPGGIFNMGRAGGKENLRRSLNLNLYFPNGYWPATPVTDEDNDGDLADEIPMDLNGDGSFLDDYELPGNPPQYRDGNEREHIYYLATYDHLSNLDILELPEDSPFRDTVSVSGYTFQDFNPADFPSAIGESGIAIFHTGAWFDPFARDMTQWYATLEKTNPSRLNITPNNHSNLGLLNMNNGPYWEFFNIDAEEIKHGYNMERLRFLDRYLKGVENGVDTEPPIYIYVMNKGWRFENEWPLARQETHSYYFNAENMLSGDPGSEGTDDYTADLTHNTLEPDTGINHRYTLGAQNEVTIRTDNDLKCLVYTTAPVEKDTEVTGHPVIHFWVSSTADYGDFFVYLEDVDENGESYMVTEGILRAGFANLIPNEDMLTDPDSGYDVLPDIPWYGFDREHYTDGMFAGGNIAELVIDLHPTSWVFKKGHSIRVSIAGADWPTFGLHPMLSPANDPADPGNIVPTITVHRSAAYPSRIELPVIPDSSEYAPGDADGNGKIDIYDALIVAQYDVGLKKQDDIPGFTVADVDGNRKVDIFDALKIAEFVAGLIPAL